MPLTMEQLESRLLLAGNVRTSIAGSTLTLIGDAEGNLISVGVDDAGNLTLSGDDTTIDGAVVGADAPLTFSGITNLRIQMYGGDDRVVIGGEEEEEPTVLAEEEEEVRLTLNSLVVDMGEGNDAFKMAFATVFGNVSIQTRGGNDTVDLGRGPGFLEEDHEEPVPTLASTDISVQSHQGSGPPTDTTIGGRLSITTGTGDDGVKIAFTEVGGRTVINTQAGDDIVVTGRGPIRGEHGEGEETAVLESISVAQAVSRPVDAQFFGGLQIATGADDDLVVLRNSQMSLLVLNTDGGDDGIALDNVYVAGNSTIAAGQGNDCMLLNAAEFGGRLNVQMYGGDDVLAATGNILYGPATINLGGGADTLVAVDNRNESTLRVLGSSGFDAAHEEGNTGAVAPVFSGFESSDVDLEAVETKLGDLFEGYLMGDEPV